MVVVLARPDWDQRAAAISTRLPRSLAAPRWGGGTTSLGLSGCSESAHGGLAVIAARCDLGSPMASGSAGAVSASDGAGESAGESTGDGG